VDELVQYITGNMEYVRNFVKENLPKAYFVEPEGTYLIWIDFSGYGFTSDELEHVMVDEAKLWLDSGKVFGPATEQFERFNLACPRSTVEQAMRQLKAALDKYQ
jgi:cystathionine beta-lyase